MRLALLVAAALLIPAGAEACRCLGSNKDDATLRKEYWDASKDVVLAKVVRDGSFEVVEVFKGTLVPGQTVKQPPRGSCDAGLFAGDTWLVFSPEPELRARFCSGSRKLGDAATDPGVADARKRKNAGTR